MTIGRGLAIATGAILVAAAALSGYFWYLVDGDRSHPAALTQVVIDRGSTLRQVAERLRTSGVISNVLSFRVLARLRGEETGVRAGEYRFEPHMTQTQVLRALVTAGAQVAAWVTIPEGFTAAQIAARLQRDGVGPAGPFLSSFKRERLVVDGTRTVNLEGFLFPSTYLVPLAAAPSEVASLMTDEFLKELPPDAASRAHSLHVTVPQTVTVASLVEREAKSEVDRPRIAEVIYNRLRLGMPLQIDAAVEYALPRYKSRLLFSDLKVDSPYNTYAHAGLPPTPIANPGKPSLEAALRPSKGADLYYVYCGRGRHVFAGTLSEHLANVARCLR
ncbi:MAG TPA: endolytic transglycosylase MltG [Candidatus Babeliales bacterium]|nr:endolytic transglycosylase MltG [Candidatus Babeliales bacterium]